MHNTFSHIKIAEAFRSQLALNMGNCVDFMMGARVVRASRFYAKIWELMSEHNDIELARNVQNTHAHTHCTPKAGQSLSFSIEVYGSSVPKNMECDLKLLHSLSNAVTARIRVFYFSDTHFSHFGICSFFPRFLFFRSILLRLSCLVLRFMCECVYNMQCTLFIRTRSVQIVSSWFSSRCIMSC